MKKHARVAVIGGGAIGCSIIYHLTKLGWDDVVLVEKSELTAGSTWHAATNGNTFHSNPSFTRLYKATYDLWETLPAETGQETGFHKVGGVNMASTPARMDEFRVMYGVGQRTGFGYELVDPAMIKSLCPFINTSGLIGGIHDPNGGHADPYGVTHAYAKGAQKRGAQIYLRTEVEGLERTREKTWKVITNRGVIEAEVIVNAAGFYANEVAAMTKAQLPMVAMQHQYMITDRIEEIALNRESPVCRDVDNSCYIRREGDGLLIGIYESDCQTFGEDGIPKNFDMALLPEDLERVLPFYNRIAERIPALSEVGIKRIVNGPFCFTPDTRPLLGWMPGQTNHFCAAGFLAGLAMGGGFGQMIAEWLVEGQPSMDMSGCDLARFGDWALGSYTRARARDAYSNRYGVSFPHEERQAGRPVRVGPLFDRQKKKGAIFGSVYGWERPLCFAPDGTRAVDHLSHRRTVLFEWVREECKALRSHVAMIDLMAFARYEIGGPGAENFLSRLFTNLVPKTVGQVRLMPMVNHAGGLMGDFTVARMKGDRFYVVGSGARQGIHGRWFEQHRPKAGVDISYLSDEWSGISIAGPKSRQLLQRLVADDISCAAFPFSTAREMRVGGIMARVMRIAFSGDLGFEIHCKIADQLQLHDEIEKAGRDLGLREIGTRATDLLRLEKGYFRTGSELSADVTPFELGIDRLVRFDKGSFIGREALLLHKQRGPRSSLVTLEIDVDDADAEGNEPVFAENECVGVITSGGFGHSVEKSLALALVKPSYCENQRQLAVLILGERRKAKIMPSPPFDPTGVILRS